MYKKNISGVKLGKLIGADRRRIYEWKNGDLMPNAYYLAKICKALDVSADYLLFGKESRCTNDT